VIGLRAGFWRFGGCRSGGSGAVRVYVADKGRNEISKFGVSAFAALMPLTPVTVSSGPFPNVVAVSSQSNNAYVVDAGALGARANEISQ
jgi:DNA-binding beta-propeller fold protein YncE